MPAFIDLTGQRFTRLVVVRRAPNRGRKTIWECRCDCGGTSYAHVNSLTAGKHRSCGCLHIETITKHGATSYRTVKDPAYRSWMSMKGRCLNPRATHYHRYGGRGIAVCDRWVRSFVNFLADMGSRPTPRHTLDRIDNNGPYAPENCRWATRHEQAQHREWTPANAAASANRGRDTFGRYA